MNLRNLKTLFSFVNISFLVATCSLFTPGESGPSSTDQNATQESQPTSLDVTSESPASESPTSTEDTFLIPGGRLLFSATDDPIPDGSVFWAPDFYLLNLADQTVEPFPVLLGEEPYRDRDAVYSPDFSHLAFERGSYHPGDPYATAAIYLYGPENAEPVQVSQTIQGYAFNDLTWSLNSHFLTFWSNEGRDHLDKLSVYDVETASLKEISFPGRTTLFPALSPDGEQIAYMFLDAELDEFGSPTHTHDPDTGLYLMNAAGSDAHQLISGEIKNIMWHPDGTRIFYEREITEVDPSTDTLTVISPSQIYSFDLASGLETLLTPSSTEIFLFDISPDGKFMTYGTNTGIYLISSEGGPSVKAPGYDPGIWSPDSQYKAYGFGTSEPESDGIYIMDIQGRGQVMVYHDIHVIDIYAWLP